MDGERLNEIYNDQASNAGYVASQTVNEAHSYLQEVSAGKPADYDSKYSDDLGKIYDRIVNQGAYSFDMRDNQLYNQYRDAYQAAGRQATQQTAQQASALTGGWGNTWANAQAGQQYGELIRSMNDILPQIEQNAYGEYAAEQSRLANLYNVAQSRDDTEYGRYRDRLSDWQADREYAQQAAQQAYQNDYQQYSDRLNTANTLTAWGREDQVQARQEAYAWALKLIQAGILPTADILAQAGIGDSDALKLAKKYGYKPEGSTGGKGRRGSGSAAGAYAGDDGGVPVGAAGVTGRNDAGSVISNFIKTLFG